MSVSDNVIPFPNMNTTIDDDEIIGDADEKIMQWQAGGHAEPDRRARAVPRINLLRR